VKRATLCVVAVVLLAAAFASSETRRKVILDQDARGPATTDQQSMLLVLQSAEIETLGITIVSGDQWRDEEVAHTLRMLELTGHSDIKVYPGAVFPLINNREEIKRWEQLYGKVSYQGAWSEHKTHAPSGADPTGAWNSGVYRGPFEVPNPLPEGNPTLKAATEDAAHFMIRMVHKYPHEVTIYEGGPMTNLAVAISIDPQFPELAEELVFMGGSLGPQTDNAEFGNNPRHEFNFWFDPEAAHVVLRAAWKKIVCTPVDISVKTRLTPAMVQEIDKAGTPLAHYVARYFQNFPGADIMWDELAAAAWIDPSIITKRETRYMSVDLDHGAGYGNTLTWSEKDKPARTVQPVEIQLDLDKEKFYRMFIVLMSAPTPTH